ncbi:MAG: hypothetical protein Q9196_001236 [Gyalolechia fulgens]
MGECYPEGTNLSPTFNDHDPSDSDREDFRENERTSVAYHNLTVYGFDARASQQSTFLNLPLTVISRLARWMVATSQDLRCCIVQGFEGIASNGELLLVLGKPGSGCTTLLRVLAGDTHGLEIDSSAALNYQGTSIREIHQHSRGDYTYLAESDVHFAHLTVSQTLTFAAQARSSFSSRSRLHRFRSATRTMKQTTDALGLQATLHTKLGDNFVRGISGGERKRASIAEVLVGASRLQCWDNSIRGLDSANALQFVQTLRSSAMRNHTVAIATLYQASEDIYHCFDKVTVLYEGREIYFGPTAAAKEYFTELGFLCSRRSTTADFLCSVTNPLERVVQEGYEDKVPRTAAEFARTWECSRAREKLVAEIQAYQAQYPLDGKSSRHVPPSTIRRGGTLYSNGMLGEIHLCVVRGYQRLIQDLTPMISGIIGNAVISIILGSMFYDMPNDTSSFFGRGVLLFFTILTNTLLASFEGVQLWDHRPIVEKQYRFAFYHRSTEAIASMLCDLPNKVLLTTGFNVPFYFLANMRRTPAAFLTFYLFAFTSLLTGSMLYRTIGAMSRTLTASIAPGSNFILLLVIYTGFVLPIPSMHPWLRWVGYLNPVGYAFESLMINEFDGRKFPCVNFVPGGAGYTKVGPGQQTCAVTGAVAGSAVVDGRSYLATTFQYFPEHLWRNLGILYAFMVFLCCLYLLATEFLPAERSKGEVVVFKNARSLTARDSNDREAHNASHPSAGCSEKEPSEHSVEPFGGQGTQRATFVWDNLSYEIKTGEGHAKLLAGVEGWIEPGTLTALMGDSGAGKTTLLNVLANRADVGVVSGEMVVNMEFQNEGFARKVGYAQQQDSATATATVKEALVFSARLRQASKFTDAEKIAYVEEVIAKLDLHDFADAVIGVPGEGLNIEQRKRVTIGIELAARPELLLFLDEPTSGLDSNTAWSICTLLRKLADSGQAILCTIHQPSVTVFEMFDRLLFIQNGRSIYFGNIGPGSRTIIEYFTRHGAAECGSLANPAEWLMDITSRSKGTTTTCDWPGIWANSPERRQIKESLTAMKSKLKASLGEKPQHISRSKYALPYLQQLYHVTKRNLQQDWRTPSYLYSKVFLALGCGLIIGFSFYMSSNSLQGVQNQIFSVFLLFTLHSSLVQLVMPRFLERRSLYELSERPSRMYRWDVFVVSNVISEIPSQTVLAIIQFLTWYYPVGMYKNALSTHDLNERSGLMLLLLLSYMLFSSTFSQMVATIMPNAATGINISSLLYSLSLIFCGYVDSQERPAPLSETLTDGTDRILVAPSALPRFWIFMYRSTPITYFVNAMVSTGLAGVTVKCSTAELVEFDPPATATCGQYLRGFATQAGGALLNPDATQQCQFCTVSTTDALIARLGIFYQNRWRNFGISLAYCVINIVGALLLYRLFRVPFGVHRARR